MVDLARQIAVVLLGRLEDDLGTIGKLMCGKIDLAKAAFADESLESVVPDGVKIAGGELVKEGLVGIGELEVMRWLATNPYRPLGHRGSHFVTMFLFFVLGLRPDRWH